MTRSHLVIIGAAACAVAVSALLLTGVLNPTNANGPDDAGHHSSQDQLPLEVKRVFDDRERALDAVGTSYFYLDEGFVDEETGCDFCIGVAYTPGSHDGATLAFKRTEPLDLNPAKVLTFDVKGDTGNEVIKIFALGSKTEDPISNTDSGLRGVSFQFSKEIKLSSDWQSYAINLQDLDRSAITYGFAFEILKGTGSEKQYVYFDAIQFEATKPDYAISLN